MLIPFALLAPHLPTLALDRHRGHRTRMICTLEESAAKLAAAAPAAVVALSARWNAPGPFRVDGGRQHRTLTDYSGLGVEVRYDCPGEPALARALVEAGHRAGLPVGLATRGVDSAISVPLSFLLHSHRIPVVPLSLPQRSPSECRAWGAAIRRALTAWPERVAFVAGGSLSHNLHAWGLKREVAETAELDDHVMEALERGAWDEARSIPSRVAEAARPEAKLLHLEVLRGFLGEGAVGRVLCYESGPGVGEALVEFALEAPSAPSGEPAEAPGTPVAAPPATDGA